MKRTLLFSIPLLLLLLLLVGCSTILPLAQLSANPELGYPSFFDGGMLVTFATNGVLDSINYGDGSEIGTALTHLYTKVGTYTATAEILVNGERRNASVKVVVRNDPPEVYPPFVAGSYVQERGFALVDGRKQQHGCSFGDETALNYGAWPRYGETFIYSWTITITRAGIADLVVTGQGTEEYPLELIRWHVGASTKVFSDMYPVPTIYGIWIPPNYTPQGCPPSEDPIDPWDIYPGVPKTAKGKIEMTATNQFGCFATATNVVDVYMGGGCSGAACL